MKTFIRLLKAPYSFNQVGDVLEAKEYNSAFAIVASSKHPRKPLGDMDWLYLSGVDCEVLETTNSEIPSSFSYGSTKEE